MFYKINLAAKAGELSALLKDERPENSRVLLELLPSSFGSTTFSRLMDVISSAEKNPIAIDDFYSKPAGKSFLDLSQTLGPSFLSRIAPVITPRSSRAEVVQALAHAQEHCGCLTYRVQPLTESANIENELFRFLEEWRIGEDLVDFQVDFGNVSDGEVLEEHFRKVAHAIADRCSLKSVTVAATSFPDSISTLDRGWNPLPRPEFDAWKSVVESTSSDLSFGDYGPKSVKPPAEKFDGPPSTLAQIRYTYSGGYLVFRGELLRPNPAQHVDICKQLIDRTEYRGRDFSWEDEEVLRLALATTRTGSRQSFITMETSHHLCLTAEQVAEAI